MRRIAEQGKTPRPDTADELAKEDAERDKHSELKFLLQICLVAMRVRFAVMVMMVVTVIVQSVSP